MELQIIYDSTKFLFYERGRSVFNAIIPLKVMFSLIECLLPPLICQSVTHGVRDLFCVNKPKKGILFLSTNNVKGAPHPSIISKDYPVPLRPHELGCQL